MRVAGAPLLSFRRFWWTAAGVLVAAAVFASAAIVRKHAAQSRDRGVSIVVDWNDIRDAPNDRSLRDRLQEAVDAGVGLVAVPTDADVPIATIRAAGLSILWRPGDASEDASEIVLRRSREGDGVLSQGDVALGYPRAIDAVARTVKLQGAFLPVVEFASQKGDRLLQTAAFPQVVRLHCLQAKERLRDRRAIEADRLVRAVRDRWVRLLYVQFSPVLSYADNIAFLETVMDRLGEFGFIRGASGRFPVWSMPVSGKTGALGALLLTVVGPVIGLGCALTSRTRSTAVRFITASVVSVAAGLAAHGLGASPEAAAGLVPLRGVKLQLLAPLLAAFILLVKREEWRGLLGRPIRYGEAIAVGAFALAFFGVYLMRSGNDPILPVLDVERRLRDVLERVLVARPRFKEFLIGHPVLIAGLFVSIRAKADGFLRDGRFLLALGVVGQISIANTFLHYYAPVEIGLLRTFHGLWLGAILGWLLCRGLRRWGPVS